MTVRIRRVLTVGAVMTALAAPATTAAAAAARSPLDALRAGAAPRSVPYAIGTSVYYRGHRTDVGARIDRANLGTRPSPAQRQLVTVVGGAGYAWAHFTGTGADIVHVVGRIGPRGGWTGFHSSSGAFSRVAITTTRLVVMPESGMAYRADGSLAATFSGSAAVSCGFCGPQAAGPQIVVDRKPSMPGTEHQGTWLWRPGSGAAPQRLPDGTVALGRLGAGWLGISAGTAPGAACWRVAPATSPDAVRARICSQALPLVSADGTRAVVVQGSRLRVVDTRTGTQVSRAGLVGLGNWDPVTRSAVPAAWETTDHYLAVARDDPVLALVRCSVSTGRCERAVRSTVRTGVTGIVSERGPADAVPMG